MTDEICHERPRPGARRPPRRRLDRADRRQAANKTWPRDTEIYELAADWLRIHPTSTLADYQAERVVRRRSWRANQQHMAGYHLTVLAALAFGRVECKWIALILAISWVTHSFIDRRWPVKWLMRHTGSGPFSETTFGAIAVDQALHLSVLCLLVAAT